MIITISGTSGSGKSSVAKALAKALGYKHYSMGDLRRENAKKKGMTLEEYNAYGEQHPETDKEVDEMQRELGQQEDNFVIDGRLSYHFIPHSVKIFLDANLSVRTGRVLQQERYGSYAEEKVQGLIQQNDESDINRYAKHYGLNHKDPTQYDHILDTSEKSISQMVEQIVGLLTQQHGLVKA